MDKQPKEQPKENPPAQQPANPPEPPRAKAADAKQDGRKPWKFCWYDIFRGPYQEHTSKPKPEKVDMEPYDFEKLLKVKLDNRPS